MIFAQIEVDEARPTAREHSGHGHLDAPAQFLCEGVLDVLRIDCLRIDKLVGSLRALSC